jgi:hypothetical protein
MAQSISGNGEDRNESVGKITTLGSSKLVVTHVEVIKQREIIKVPEIVIEKRPTIEYVPTQETTIKYTPKEEVTIKYVPEEKKTILYTTVDKETIKYIPIEQRCEKPIVTDKIYERPVIIEKEYQIVSFKDLEAIKELIEIVPKLLVEINKLKTYRLVEEIIKVPKINYIPTDVFKITKSGELVKDASS